MKVVIILSIFFYKYNAYSVGLRNQCKRSLTLKKKATLDQRQSVVLKKLGLDVESLLYREVDEEFYSTLNLRLKMISVKHVRLIEFIDELTVKGSDIFFKLILPIGMSLDEYFDLFPETLKDSNYFTKANIDENGRVSVNIIDVPKSFMSEMKKSVKSNNDDIIYEVRERRIKRVPATNINVQRMIDFLEAISEFRVTRSGYVYKSKYGDIIVPKKSESVIVQNDMSLTEFYYVIQRVNESYLIGDYDGRYLNFKLIKQAEVSDAYDRKPLYSSDLNISIYFRTSQILLDQEDFRSNLSPFRKSALLGSLDSRNIFQIRGAGDALYNNNKFSLHFYLSLINESFNLSFDQLLSNAARARRSIPIDHYRRALLGIKRTKEASSSSMNPFENASRLSRIFVDNFSGMFTESDFEIHGKVKKVFFLSQDGVRLTGYDFHSGADKRWIHPSGDDLLQGIVKMKSIYEMIKGKKYRDLLDLQKDVATFHWWAVHVMMFRAGNAAIIDYVTKYLFFLKGYHPSRWKIGVVPDVSAFTNPLSVYVDLYPTFFE